MTLEKYETYWGQPVTTQAMMTFLKTNGVSSIRIPVTWYEHMDDAGNVDDTWMNRVKEVTDYALSAGLYVIVNVHHDTAAGKGAWIKADMDVYNNTKERFKKLWTQIANTFRDYDQHLLFEATTKCSTPPTLGTHPKTAAATRHSTTTRKTLSTP
ncbi:glycoside hydrolase family 5 protein [Segatella baroniae]|uniref:glycoside hydrolase family 5 protein n=1 Tax=Segatella baroniae TaxID=305719 RepID=UPI0021D20B69|nr:glycoside hydrolase family 5 protein [Segatella baroniae]